MPKRHAFLSRMRFLSFSAFRGVFCGALAFHNSATQFHIFEIVLRHLVHAFMNHLFLAVYRYGRETAHSGVFSTPVACNGIIRVGKLVSGGRRVFAGGASG